MQVHAHLIQWYVLAVNGKPVEENFPELWHVPKDVILIGAGNGEIALAARFGPSLGRYLVCQPASCLPPCVCDCGNGMRARC